MRVAVIGSGAMGCRFGSSLHKAGAEVWLYDIWKEHIDRIKKDGLRVHNGDSTELLRINATTDITEIPRPDVLIIFTKTIHTENAMAEALKVIDKKTVVITLQNGLGNIESIAKHISIDNIIAGITNYATDLIGPGEIEFKGSGVTKIMPLGEYSRPAASEIHALLNSGGINTKISDDVMIDIWEKVAFNAAFNILTALTFLTVGGLGKTPEGLELAKIISSEVIMVANKIGINASIERVHNTIESVIIPHCEHKPSMLQDRLLKRKTEVDSICGWVLKTAKENSIDKTDHLETVYKLVKIIETNYNNQVI